MRREGTTNRPYYRIVVADERSPRDGKFIEQVGTYDPTKKTDTARVDLARIDHWVKNGAQPSDTVASLVKKAKKVAASVVAA